MNLTTQEKARLMAMYFGCPVMEYKDGVAYPFDGGVVDADVIDRVVNVDTEVKLHLRPLSAITDEDAIEVAKCYWIPLQATPESGREIIQDITSGDFNTDYCLSQAWEMYTLLIGRGYAVPLYFSQDEALYGKTAIELGLAIDATQTSTTQN